MNNRTFRWLNQLSLCHPNSSTSHHLCHRVMDHHSREEVWWHRIGHGLLHIYPQCKQGNKELFHRLCRLCYQLCFLLVVGHRVEVNTSYHIPQCPWTICVCYVHTHTHTHTDSISICVLFLFTVAQGLHPLQQAFLLQNQQHQHSQVHSVFMIFT